MRISGVFPMASSTPSHTRGGMHCRRPLLLFLSLLLARDDPACGALHGLASLKTVFLLHNLHGRCVIVAAAVAAAGTAPNRGMPVEHNCFEMLRNCLRPCNMSEWSTPSDTRSGWQRLTSVHANQRHGVHTPD